MKVKRVKCHIINVEVIKLSKSVERELTFYRKNDWAWKVKPQINEVNSSYFFFSP
jgi:hypothetical protein